MGQGVELEGNTGENGSHRYYKPELGAPVVAVESRLAAQLDGSETRELR